jgi:hypothetical protein
VHVQSAPVLLVDTSVVELDTGPVVSVVELVLVDVASVVLEVVDALVVPSVIPLVPVPSVVVGLVVVGFVDAVLVDDGSVVGPLVVPTPVVVPDADESVWSSPHAVSATAADSTPR